MRYARLYALGILLGIFLWDGYWLYPFRPPFGGDVWIRGNPKILAKSGNSVVKPLLKPVQIAEEMRAREKRNA